MRYGLLGGHAPAVFEPIKDPVSGRITGAVDRVLDILILLGGDLGRAAPGSDFVSDGVAVLSLIGQHDHGIRIVLGPQMFGGPAIVGLAGCREECDRRIRSVGRGVVLNVSR